MLCGLRLVVRLFCVRARVRVHALDNRVEMSARISGFMRMRFLMPPTKLTSVCACVCR